MIYVNHAWMAAFQYVLTELEYAAANYTTHLKSARMFVEMGNVDSTATSHAGKQWMNLTLYWPGKNIILEVITDHDGHSFSFTGVSDHHGGGCYNASTSEREWTKGEVPQMAKMIAYFFENAIMYQKLDSKPQYTELDVFGTKAIIKDGMPGGV